MNKTGIKFFLRGLGTGMVLTALICCVSYRLNDNHSDIVEQAKALGMVFPEGTAQPQPKLTTQPETEATKQPEAESTQKTETTKKPQQTPKTEKEEKKGVKFTVRSGLLSSSVAREMREAGIIKSDTALDDYLEKNGYATSIREGTYYIPKGAGYEEIAKIITGKK